MKGIVFLLLICTKLFAAEMAPFANLNQYFKYKSIDISSFEINNNLYTVDDLQINRVNSEIQLKIEDISPFRSASTQIEVMDAGLKKTKIFTFNKTKNEFNQKLPLDMKKSEFICIAGANEFTTKRMCKKIPGTKVVADSDEKPVASANGTPLGYDGQIILNQRDSSLRFKVERSNFFFEVTTSNKNIVINRAYKFEKSNTIQAEFIDLNHPDKYRFKKNILLSDTFFEVTYDDLLTVFQDIVFLDSQLFTKAVDYEFKGWADSKYNKFGIEPIGLYSQLILETSTVRAKIVSDLSKGVKLYLAHYLESSIEYHYAAKLILMHMRDDVNRNTIANNTLSLISLEGGARYFQNPSLFYDLSGSLEESVFAETLQNSTLLNMVKALTPRLKLGVNTLVLEYQKWRWQAQAEAVIVGPASLPAGATQTAVGYSVSTTLSYKLRAGRIYYGADFSGLTASNSTYRYNFQSLEHAVGFYYLF